jgi:hypothetical protein
MHYHQMLSLHALAVAAVLLFCGTYVKIHTTAPSVPPGVDGVPVHGASTDKP